MSQTVTVHYTENLSSSGDSPYKTRRFTCEMSREVNDDADINGITERLFSVVKANVQAQVERAKGDIALKEMNGMNGKSPVPAAPLPAQPANGNGAPRLASQKQIKFILELAKKAGMSHDEIRRLPSEFNQTSLTAIKSSDASILIDRLSQKKAA